MKKVKLKEFIKRLKEKIESKKEDLNNETTKKEKAMNDLFLSNKQVGRAYYALEYSYSLEKARLYAIKEIEEVIDKLAEEYLK